jgi:hypothetical protein
VVFGGLLSLNGSIASNPATAFACSGSVWTLDMRSWQWVESIPSALVAGSSSSANAALGAMLNTTLVQPEARFGHSAALFDTSMVTILFRKCLVVPSCVMNSFAHICFFNMCQLIFGGINSLGVALNDVWRLDMSTPGKPASWTWSLVSFASASSNSPSFSFTTMPHPRAFARFVVILFVNNLFRCHN